MLKKIANMKIIKFDFKLRLSLPANNLMSMK